MRFSLLESELKARIEEELRTTTIIPSPAALPARTSFRPIAPTLDDIDPIVLLTPRSSKPQVARVAALVGGIGAVAIVLVTLAASAVGRGAIPAAHAAESRAHSTVKASARDKTGPMHEFAADAPDVAPAPTLTPPPKPALRLVTKRDQAIEAADEDDESDDESEEAPPAKEAAPATRTSLDAAARTAKMLREQLGASLR